MTHTMSSAAHSSAHHSAPRLDPRDPFVLDTRELGRRPGSMRRVQLRVPAPGDFAIDVVGVPAGAPVDLDLRLEAVMDGVLVSGLVTAPVAGECGRCLEPVTDEVEVDVQELFVYEPTEADDEDVSLLHGDLIDIEQVVRDAVVLALPLAPLCDDACPGLCPSCGVRLAEAGPDHHHDEVDPRWAALTSLLDEQQQDDTNDNRKQEN